MGKIYEKKGLDQEAIDEYEIAIRQSVQPE
jgi:hypothetical protein